MSPHGITGHRQHFFELNVLISSAIFLHIFSLHWQTGVRDETVVTSYYYFRLTAVFRGEPGSAGSPRVLPPSVPEENLGG